MGQKRGGWQGLLQYIAAHMHEPVGNDRLDRALVTMSGRLCPNSPFVEASFQPLRGVQGSVKDVAISPKGTIAIVLWRTAGPDDYDELCLVVWRGGAATEPRVIWTAREIAEDDQVLLLFPQGSDEPAVCVRGTIVWGGRTKTLIVPTRALPSYAQLTLWEDADGRRSIAYVDGDSIAHQHQVPFGDFEPNLPAESVVLPGETRWLGLVGGSLARITLETNASGSERETLMWRDAVWNNPAWTGKIVIASIGLVNGGMQFLQRADKETCGIGPTAHRVEVNGRKRLYSNGRIHAVYLFDRGRIFAVSAHGSTERPEFSVEEFGPEGRFTQVGSNMFSMPTRDGDTRVSGLPNGAVVISNSARPGSDPHCITIMPDGCVVSDARAGVARFHDGIAVEWPDADTFEWSVPRHAKFGDGDRVVGPLYGTPFSRLIPVEDHHRGKAIMTWAFTDGTFHVLRYPLPSPR